MSLAALPPGPRRHVVGVTGIAAFLVALSVVDGLTRGLVSLPALVPPFGASVVIVFLAPDSVYGRPWNVVVGHLCNALAATAVLALLPGASTAVLGTAAVSIGGLLMIATRSFHPPGGATALLAVLAQPRLGAGLALCPILVGAVLLIAIRAVVDEAVAHFG